MEEAEQEDLDNGIISHEQARDAKEKSNETTGNGHDINGKEAEEVD